MRICTFFSIYFYYLCMCASLKLLVNLLTISAFFKENLTDILKPRDWLDKTE